MKRILLLFASAACISALYAQDSKKVTAYAITGVQKGSSGWTEVRLVDFSTGDEIQSVYKSATPVEPLNARTGQAIKKVVTDPNKTIQEQKTEPETLQIIRKDEKGNITTIERRVVFASSFNNVDVSKPFATNSAALAYDKKHERLYYTPM